MTPHWTPRERALRAALEELKAEYEGAGSRDDERKVTYKWSLTRINAALADPPPPDARDAALRLAEDELLRLWKLVPTKRGDYAREIRFIPLNDIEVARLRQIVDAIRVAKGGA